MPEEVKYTMSLNDLVSSKIKEADQTANNFEGTLSRIQSAAAKVGIAIGLAFAVTAATDFAKSVVDAGSKVENARTGLTTLLKDSATASQVIQDTMTDATKTPFAFEGLLSANKALISAGESATEARGTVLNLANAIAATGGGDDELQRMVVNLQQIRNVGTATQLDIKQFAFAGINVYKLLANEIYHTNDATAKQVASVKDTKVTYELLTRSLQSAHEVNGIYANGLENMAKNTSVQISNIGDAIFQFKVKVFDDFKPAIDGAISGTLELLQSLSSLYDKAKSPQTLNAVVKVLKDIRDFAYGAAIGIGVATAAYAIANPIIILYTGSLIINGIATVGLTVATYAMTAAQWLLNAAMTANPVGLIVVSIGLLVGGLVLAYKHSEKFRAVLSGLGEIAKDIGGIFKGLGEQILGALTFNPALMKKGFEDAASSFHDIGVAFHRGYTESLAESAANEAREKAGESTIAKLQKKAPIKPATGTGIKPAGTTSKVTGSKVLNINIKIDNVIKEFNIKTTNLKEGVNKAQSMVAEALLSAINDSQIAAD